MDTVLVVGANSIGATIAAQLACVGVGHLGVVDGGVVTARDLRSVSVHFTPDLGRKRAESVVAKLGVLNPAIQVDSYPVAMTADNAAAIVESFELAICADRDSRLVVNDACLETGTPLLDVLAEGRGVRIQRVPRVGGPCLRCDPIEPAPSDARLAQIAGSLAALQVVGPGSPNFDEPELIEFDAERTSLCSRPVACSLNCGTCRAMSERWAREAVA